MTTRLLALLAALTLVSCQGLTLTTNPDGSISGSYVPPAKPVVVIPAK